MLAAMAPRLFLIAALAYAASPAACADVGPKFNFLIGAGRFQPDTGGALQNREGDGGFELGFGTGFAPGWGWDASFMVFSQDVDTPAGLRNGGFLVRTDPRADVVTNGFVGQLRYATRIWRLEPFAAIGAGWYRSELHITRSSIATSFSLGDASIKKKDSDIGTHLLLGAELRLGTRWSLGWQQRWLSLQASFGPEVPGSVDVGGKLRFITSRWTF
jgi:hypothetical protein